MSIFSSKRLAIAAAAMGLAGLLVSSVSLAHPGPWRHANWVSTKVRIHGCRKVVIRRFCRNNRRRGLRYCTRVRHVYWRC